MSKETMSEKVDTMFDYGPDDVEEAEQFIAKIEGTDAFWHLIAILCVKSTEMRRLEERISELEQINENMRDSFRRKNEYGF